MNLKIYGSKDLVFDYARDMRNLSIFLKLTNSCLGCQKRYTSINSNSNMPATTYIYIKLTESHKVFISQLNTSRCSTWQCSFLTMWKLQNRNALDHDKFSLKILDLSQITSSLQLFPKELSFMTPHNNILKKIDHLWALQTNIHLIGFLISLNAKLLLDWGNTIIDRRWELLYM